MFFNFGIAEFMTLLMIVLITFVFPTLIVYLFVRIHRRLEPIEKSLKEK